MATPYTYLIGWTEYNSWYNAANSKPKTEEHKRNLSLSKRKKIDAI